MAKGLSKSQMRRILYGPSAARVIARATPKQRKRLQTAARRRGITLNSLVSGVPTPLAERNFDAIRRHATRTVKAAYKPIFSELNSQARAIRNLDAKRRADAEYYQRWYSDQARALIDSAEAYNRGVQQHQQALADQARRMYEDAANQIAVANALRTGSVTLGNQEAAAAASATAPAATFAANLLAADQSKTAGELGTQSDLLRASVANAQSVLANADLARAAETSRALQDIRDARRRALASRSADLQREIARLLDQEVSKASSREQLNLARAELGQKRWDAEIQHALKRQELAERRRQNRIRNRLNRAALNERRRHNLASEYNDRRNTDLRAKGLANRIRQGRRPRPKLTQNQINTIRRQIDQARSVASFLSGYGVPWKTIINSLKTGGSYHDEDTGREVRWGALPGPVAWAGWQQAKLGRISPKIRKQLKAMGFEFKGQFLRRGR